MPDSYEEALDALAMEDGESEDPGFDDSDMVLKTTIMDNGEEIHVWEDYSVAGVVGDHQAGETIDERNARILAGNAAERQVDRPTGEARERRAAAFDPSDAASLRLVFRRGAESEGLSLTELLRRTPPGRPTEEEKHRRDVLAKLVAQARDERQARVETIAEVINRPIVTVHQLAADGRRLAAAG
jgi:hypothetical protein